MAYEGPRRKVFVSYFQEDRIEVNAFVQRWAYQDGVFIPKTVGVSSSDDFIDSTNTDYVMSRIRGLYLGDSTVTMVLVGSCTHSRRYVDWELKSSLRRGSYTPTGVMGVILPSQGQNAYLPPRLEANWNPEHTNCYARYWIAPRSASELGSWIEDAFAARVQRAHLIQNSSDMMRYNRECRMHGVTH